MYLLLRYYLNTTESFYSVLIVQYDCKFPQAYTPYVEPFAHKLWSLVQFVYAHLNEKQKMIFDPIIVQIEKMFPDLKVKFYTRFESNFRSSPLVSSVFCRVLFPIRYWIVLSCSIGSTQF
jgi:hypothetical protein